MLRHEYYISVVPVQYYNEAKDFTLSTYQFVMNSKSGPFRGRIGAIYFRYVIENITMRYVHVS